MKRALVVLLALCLPATQALVLAEAPEADPPEAMEVPAETAPPAQEIQESPAEAAPTAEPPREPEATPEEEPRPETTPAEATPEASALPEDVELTPEPTAPAEPGEVTPEPLAPEPTVAPTPRPGETPPAATAAPTPTRAPYVEVYVRIDGLSQPLTAGESASLRFAADYCQDRRKAASSDAQGRNGVYDQRLAKELVDCLYVTFEDSFSRVFESADGRTPKAWIVLPVDGENWESLGLTRLVSGSGEVSYIDAAGESHAPGEPFNVGVCALEGLTVRPDADPGVHSVDAVLRWRDKGANRETTVPFAFQVNVRAAAAPTLEPEATLEPTDAPTEGPTVVPTPVPMDAPIDIPIDEPTDEPTDAPTGLPTYEPTEEPTDAPTETPTEAPTHAPTEEPVDEPTDGPVVEPTLEPTDAPTGEPTDEPTHAPAADASVRPGTIYTTQGTLLPGGEFSAQFGIEYLEDGAVRLRTNADGQPDAKYSQAIARVISHMWVELDAESYCQIFASDSAEAPSSQVVLRVDPQNAESAGLTQDRRDGNLFRDGYGNEYRTGDSFNNGFASFYGMTLRSDLEAGEYEQKGTIYFQTAGENPSLRSATFSFPIAVSAPEPDDNPGGGGGGYGGGGGGGSGVSEPDPEAKLIIEQMSTEPAEPRPGDAFDLLLTLRNTSDKQPVRNIDLTFKTDGDVIRPASGLNRTHLGDMEPNQTQEVRLKLRAGVDIGSDLVHMDVSLDYEDKSGSAKSSTQEVFLFMDRVQRMDVGEPELPSDVPIAQESFTVKIGVTNKGRNTLENVTAVVTSEDGMLLSGGSWYGGNMEPGTQKTAELELIPGESGDFTAKVEVSYEDSVAGTVVTEARDICFSVMEAETYDDYYDESYEDYAEQEPTEEYQPTLQERISNLPPWLFAALGAAVVLLLMGMSALARRLRRRGMDDDEMD